MSIIKYTVPETPRLDPYSGDKGTPQSFNKYGYTHADPINALDPTGKFLVGIMEILGGVGQNLFWYPLWAVGNTTSKAFPYFQGDYGALFEASRLESERILQQVEFVESPYPEGPNNSDYRYAVTMLVASYASAVAEFRNITLGVDASSTWLTGWVGNGTVGKSLGCIEFSSFVIKKLNNVDTPSGQYFKFKTINRDNHTYIRVTRIQVPSATVH